MKAVHKTTRLISNGLRVNLASPVSAAAVTALAATAANAVMALKAAKLALKPLLLPKIGCQMRLQTNRRMRKQLLNL